MFQQKKTIYPNFPRRLEMKMKKLNTFNSLASYGVGVVTGNSINVGGTTEALEEVDVSELWLYDCTFSK